MQTRLRVDNWENLSRALNREEVEFFIADIRHFEADPNFQTQALTPRRGLFFCRPAHPLLKKDSLSTNDLFDYPLAAPQILPGARKLLANLSGKTDFSPQVQTEHLPTLLKVVLGSDAIGIGPEEAFANEIAAGELVELHWRNLPVNPESLNARCGIVSRSGYRLSPAARAMIETLVSLDRQPQAAALALG